MIYLNTLSAYSVGYVIEWWDEEWIAEDIEEANLGLLF
jgi:hypothetical protein